MRALRIICCTVLVLALAATFIFACHTSVQQGRSGKYSSVATVTDRSRHWLLEQFGHCETVPELLEEIDRFGCKNFVYDIPRFQVVQNFWLDTFIFEDEFHGVCFDFSSFVKCAVLVWAEAHQREDVRAYVYNVRESYQIGHSYNFVTEDGHTWFLCTTTDNTYTKEGKKPFGVTELKGITPMEYALRHYKIVMGIH